MNISMSDTDLSELKDASSQLQHLLLQKDIETEGVEESRNVLHHDGPHDGNGNDSVHVSVPFHRVRRANSSDMQTGPSMLVYGKPPVANP